MAVVTGNPKPQSRTLSVALAVADALTGAIAPWPSRLVAGLPEHAASLFDWSAPALSALTAEVAAADIAIFASPTYKASYTGMLPVEVHLRPVLVELGATDRPRPRPLCHRTRAPRARRRGGEVDRHGRPAHHPCAEELKQFSRTYPSVSTAPSSSPISGHTPIGPRR